ncbi:alpha-amylase [Mobiluncus mulieris]|uniref:Alpha-amylase n=2 Tax=Mobiluncus mulieris TaxID=2052 RepID=A0A7Y0TXV1_9ACTO|nr:alpha-amylase family glycosyl hydrolase [Mobiluncus mulieris]MCU9971411.1 alpha-amylase [Mobiluncus mulieris]MCU9997054.1 alpha-amylase [Mobiluncus mulieris]NMW61085.1 alpha-amylase [Mobiluncus mulieris]NMW63202.1 alpha-amylase [Mobiluncus mulieris]NMW64906.1 alpha-amylase [Mobiluncus mulieris]
MRCYLCPRRCQICASLPQDHIRGKEWWTSYQPTSYKLNSKLGTEAEFKSMVAACQAQGVGITVDTVINHTVNANVIGSLSVGGTKHDIKNLSFPDAGYTKEDFHSEEKNIEDYKDPKQVWNYRLGGLLDLDTSKPHVRQTIGKFYADLLAIGVAGFRIDAVQHMSPEDLLAIKQEAAKQSGRNCLPQCGTGRTRHQMAR